MNPTPRPSLMGMLKGLPRATPTVLHVEQHGEDFFGVPFPANCVTLARQVVEDARRRAHAAGVPGDSPYPAATGRFGWQALLFKRAFNVALATRPPEQDDEPDDMLAALRDEPLVDHSVTEPLDGTPHPVVSAAKWQTTPRHLAARKAAEAPLATPRPPVRRYEVIDEIPFGHHDPILDAADRKRCAEIAVIRAGYQSVAPPQPIVAPRTPIRGNEGYIYEPAEEEAEDDVPEFETVVSPPPPELDAIVEPPAVLARRQGPGLPPPRVDEAPKPTPAPPSGLMSKVRPPPAIPGRPPPVVLPPLSPPATGRGT